MARRSTLQKITNTLNSDERKGHGIKIFRVAIKEILFNKLRIKHARDS